MVIDPVADFALPALGVMATIMYGGARWFANRQLIRLDKIEEEQNKNWDVLRSEVKDCITRAELTSTLGALHTTIQSENQVIAKTMTDRFDSLYQLLVRIGHGLQT